MHALVRWVNVNRFLFFLLVVLEQGDHHPHFFCLQRHVRQVLLQIPNARLQRVFGLDHQPPIQTVCGHEGPIDSLVQAGPEQTAAEVLPPIAETAVENV